MKRQFLKALTAGTVFAGLILGGILFSSKSGQAANDNNPTQDEKQKIQIGQKIAPVTLTIGKKDSDTVYLGSYLVNAMAGCNDCHTNPPYSSSPYNGVSPKVFNAAAYLGGGMMFGPFTSRNLTPDSTGKPAGLTYAEFVQVIRTGKDFDNQHMGLPLQVMPWPVYQSMTDRDLTAIYTYLSTIPCLEGDPGVVPPDPGPRCH